MINPLEHTTEIFTSENIIDDIIDYINKSDGFTNVGW